jgi:hypothetical protein
MERSTLRGVCCFATSHNAFLVNTGNPSVTIGYDVDRVEAEHEHWRTFGDAARNRYLVGGAHLPFPGLGHVRDNGDGSYAFVPLSE